MPNPQIRTPAKWNVTLMQGSTFERNLNITSDAINLSEYDLRGQMRASYDSDAVAEFDFEITSNSSFTMSLSATDTADIPAGEYLYDIEMFTESDAFVARIVEGKIKVRPQVTR